MDIEATHPEKLRVLIAGGSVTALETCLALHELYDPLVRGIPLSEHGFLRVDQHGYVMDVKHVYAAGDATDFPVKHGGVGSQQADAVAQSIAAHAGTWSLPSKIATKYLAPYPDTHHHEKTTT